MDTWIKILVESGLLPNDTWIKIFVESGLLPNGTEQIYKLLLISSFGFAKVKFALQQRGSSALDQC